VYKTKSEKKSINWMTNFCRRVEVDAKVEEMMNDDYMRHTHAHTGPKQTLIALCPYAGP